MSSGGLEPAVAACLFPSFDGHTVPGWVRQRLAEGLGGIVLFARNISDRDQLRALTASLRAERPDLLIATDEEGGDVTRLEAAAGSSFPGNLALGAVDDVDLTRRVAAAIGGELASVGVNLDLAPDADVIVDPANPIVGVRSFGRDPELVSRHVAAFVGGLQAIGVAACAKHFPGHGETGADSHLELPVAEIDRETLLARALPPFAAAVDAGVRTVMTAHIRYPALAAEPATLSPELIGLLRAEIGFEGVVMTDALEMRAIGGTIGLEQGAVRALAAGADALCLGADRTPAEVEAAEAAVVDAVRSGRLPEQRVREAAERVAELATWASAPKPHDDRNAGAEAARRALRVEGDAGVGSEPLVVEASPEPTIAAGEAGRGLGAALGAETIRVHEGDALPAVARGRQLVLVLRDAHRHPWQRELAVPEAVVVETGLPEWRPPTAKAYLATYGAGRVNLAAAAEALRS